MVGKGRRKKVELRNGENPSLKAPSQIWKSGNQEDAFGGGARS
jgi:hypothetical protein